MAGEAMTGIGSFKTGACGTNGTMGTVLTAIGLIVPDSVMLTIAEVAITEITIEDQDGIYDTLLGAGGQPMTLDIATYNVTPAMFARAFGGSAVGEEYDFPSQTTLITQSIEWETRSHKGYKYKYQAKQASLFASLDGGFKKGGLASLKIKAKIEIPYDSSGGTPVAQSPLKVTRIAV
jgi:hypothetical protein